MVISNITIVFKIAAQKYSHKALLFQKTLHFDKFKSSDFKYDNSFLKLEPKNTQEIHFLFYISSFFNLHEFLHRR